MVNSTEPVRVRSEQFEFFLREHCIHRLQGWVVYIGLTAMVFAAIAIYSQADFFESLHGMPSEAYLTWMRRGIYTISVILVLVSLIIRRSLGNKNWLLKKVTTSQANLSIALREAMKEIRESDQPLYILLMVVYKEESFIWSLAGWLALLGSIPFILGGPSMDFLLYLGIAVALLVYHRPTVSELEMALDKFDETRSMD